MYNVFMDGGSVSDGERVGVDEDCLLVNVFFYLCGVMYVFFGGCVDLFGFVLLFIFNLVGGG